MKRGNKKINSFDFRETNWGMNKSQVRKAEREKILKEDNDLYASKKLEGKNLDKVILLFSGGKDSFLSACYLIEKGFRIFMVTFENGAGLQAYNAEHGAKRIIERYGENRASFLGVQCIAGIWRDFFLPYYNMKPSDIINNFGELTISQFHCLTCRSSMYIWSIIMAQQMGIKYIADGARLYQSFAIELPIMIKKFREFISKYSIKLLLPLYNLESDWERKNLLLLRGFVPKTLEPQCLIGVPLPNNAPPDQDTQLATLKYFDKIIVPLAKKFIKEQAKSSLLIKKGLL